MSGNIDITKIALSRSETKKLRWVAKHEPVHDTILNEDQVAQRLYDRGLLEVTYSKQYPYEAPPYGVISIPYNAIQLSDPGRQYLNRVREQDSERRVTRIIAIWGAVTGTISLLIQVMQYFQQLHSTG